MKHKNLGHAYLSALCLELSLFLNAGIPLSDGLHLLIDDDDEKKSRLLLTKLSQVVDENRPLSAAMQKAAGFPSYMTQMIVLGEKTGRLAETLSALSLYYDRQDRIHTVVKNTLLYPTILLVMMIVVIVVLLTKVLPIFNDVFRQLGTEMSSFATRLMNFGQALSDAALVIAIVAGFLLMMILLITQIPRLRSRASRFFRDLRGDRGIHSKIALARFTNAMALAMKSGLTMEESRNLAAALSVNSRSGELKQKHCAALLAEGKTLSEALSTAGVLPALYSRMLSLGVRSGSADAVMEEISRRAENTVNEELSTLINRIEPTLVIITSLIVGVILLSVMLPLMNIMSAIG